jgi:HEAT repeat protein
MDILVLNKLIQNHEIDNAIEMIEKIGDDRDVEMVPVLIEHLINTNNPLIRNSISLALSDIGDTRLLQPLLALITDPKTKGYRGSLLAALEPFDYSTHIDLLTEFLYTGNFEVSRKSFTLIEDILPKVSIESRQNYIGLLQNKIHELRQKGETEVVEFLLESIDMINES